MVFKLLSSLSIVSLSFFQDPLSYLEDFMDDPRNFIWDILIGVLFLGLGLLLFIFGNRLLMVLMKRTSHKSAKERFARLATVLLGVFLMLLGIIIGLNGLYTMFVIY